MSNASSASNATCSQPVMQDHEAGPSWRVLSGIGLSLLILAALIWQQSNSMSASAIAGVGPAAALRVVALLLAALALAHGAQAWRARVLSSPESEQEDIEGRAHHSGRASLLWVLAGLAALMASVGLGMGFVLGASVLFVATARALGQSIGFKSVGIALVLTSSVYIFFTRVLSLSLPGGPLERLFP